MDIRKYDYEQLGQILKDPEYRQNEGIELDAKVRKKIYNRRSNLNKKAKKQQPVQNGEPPKVQEPQPSQNEQSVVQNGEPPVQNEPDVVQNEPPKIQDQNKPPVQNEPPEVQPQNDQQPPKAEPEKPPKVQPQNEPPKADDFPDIPEEDDYSLIDDFAEQYGNAEPQDAINALHAVIKSIKAEHSNLRSKHLVNTAYERLRTQQGKGNPDKLLKSKIAFIAKWGNDNIGNKDHLFNLLSPAHSQAFK